MDREFEERLDLAEKAAIGPKIGIKKKSNAEILKRMIKLEQDLYHEDIKDIFKKYQQSKRKTKKVFK